MEDNLDGFINYTRNSAMKCFKPSLKVVCCHFEVDGLCSNATLTNLNGCDVRWINTRDVNKFTPILKMVIATLDVIACFIFAGLVVVIMQTLTNLLISLDNPLSCLI